MLYRVFFTETRQISTTVYADDPTKAEQLARKELDGGDADPTIEDTTHDLRSIVVLDDDEDE